MIKFTLFLSSILVCVDARNGIRGKLFGGEEIHDGSEIDPDDIPEYPTDWIASTKLGKSLNMRFNNDTDSYCPVTRYVPWDDQPFFFRSIAIAGILNILPAQWNYVFPNNLLEFRAHSVLNRPQKIVLESMLYDEDKYDCCLNHYSAYDWDDFEDEDYDWTSFKSGLENTLGYTQDIWDSGGSVPVDELEWFQLTYAQRTFLSEYMCYTQLLWDEESLPLWGATGEPVVYPDRVWQSDRNNTSS